MAVTSSSLMDQLRDGANEAAWRRFRQCYEPLLRHWMTGLQAQPADRDDLVQNVLLVVCQRFSEFQHNGRPGAFRTWLRQIVVLKCREYLRQKNRGAGRGGDGSDPVLDALADSSSELSRRWDLEHDQFIIRQKLKQIESDFTPAVWQVFNLMVLEEIPPQEVARRTGATLQAVYASKARVLARLREELHGWVEV
jgi:RNA polymerase sigma-70 factor (ECF subfamily)